MYQNEREQRNGAVDGKKEKQPLEIDKLDQIRTLRLRLLK
jgi:hypothetical protein